MHPAEIASLIEARLPEGRADEVHVLFIRTLTPEEHASGGA